MSDERFIDLESRLAEQDHLLHQLDQVVTEQQGRIMQLESLCRSLADRVRSLGEDLSAGEPGGERPPHY